MNLWEFIERRLVARELKRSGLANPEEWLLSWTGGTTSSAGISVTEESSLQVTTVWACARIIAGVLAGLPRHVYQRTERGKRRADEHYLYPFVHDEPNEEMTAYQWMEASMLHDLLWGNAYTFIDIDPRRGRINGLWPITPDRTTVERDTDSREILYQVTDINGIPQAVKAWQMLHVPGLGFDGLVGKSVIGLHREAIGLAKVTEQHGAEFFGNGAFPGAVLESDKTLGPKAVHNLKRMWNEDHQGPGKYHKVSVLGEGMKVHALTIPNEDAQFLETRSFQVAEIAGRMFGVPLWMVGEHSKDTSWGTGIEQQFIAFVTITCLPWIRRWESCMNRILFTDEDIKAGYFIAFDLKGILRGDFKSRVEGYHFGITDGWMSRNEARTLEEMNAEEGLDEFVLATGGSSPAPVNGNTKGAFAALYTSAWERAIKRARQDYARVEDGKLSIEEWSAATKAYAADLLAPIHGAWKTTGASPDETLDPLSFALEDCELSVAASRAALVSLGSGG